MAQDGHNRSHKGLTGLAKHGSVVSLAPARAMSSHARRIYREKYQGSYKYPKWIFGFDAMLIGIIAVLFAFNMSVFFRSYKSADPGLMATLLTPPLTAGEAVPIELDVEAADGKIHAGVTVGWHLPHWVEILESSPALDEDGMVNLGTIEPGGSRASRLLVRVHAKAGTKLPINFTIRQYDPLYFALDYPGSETRIIQRSVLTAKPVFSGTSYVEGGVLPIAVKNEGRSAARAVMLRLTKSEGAPEAGFGSADIYTVGDLAPGETHLVFLGLGRSVGQEVDVGWDLQYGAQVVQSQEFKLRVVPKTETVIEESIFKPSGYLDVKYTTPVQAMIWVSCQASSTSGEPWKSYEVSSGHGAISDDQAAGMQDAECDVIPVDLQTGVVGNRFPVTIGSVLPFEAEVRYFGKGGDQLGAGPLPPRVDEVTTYWVALSVGPYDQELQDVVIRSELPKGVRATGNFASAVAGEFQAVGRDVVWEVPSLPTGGGEKLSFAFEIEIKPVEQDEGKILELLGLSSVSGRTKDGRVLKAGADGGDTDIGSDTVGRNRGRVVR